MDEPLGRGWMVKAKCAGDDEWLDKPEDDQVDDCLDCPVRLLCLLYAIDTKATGVVYGGVRLGVRPLRRV